MESNLEHRVADIEKILSSMAQDLSMVIYLVQDLVRQGKIREKDLVIARLRVEQDKINLEMKLSSDEDVGILLESMRALDEEIARLESGDHEKPGPG